MCRPGKHDFEVLRQLVLPDGSVFRGLLPGRPTRDSLFKDPLRDGQALLKVWNVNRHTGVVAVFHLQGSSWDRKRRRFVIHDAKPAPLSCQVRAADVDVFNPLAANAAGQQPLAPHGFVACRQGSPELLRLRHAEDAIPITLQGVCALTVSWPRLPRCPHALLDFPDDPRACMSVPAVPFLTLCCL